MKLFLLEFFIAARFVNLAVSLPQYQFASHKGTGTPRSEQTSQASDEMDEQDDQIAHHRIVAGREIPTNYERNNNWPATGRHNNQNPPPETFQPHALCRIRHTRAGNRARGFDTVIECPMTEARWVALSGAGWTG